MLRTYQTDAIKAIKDKYLKGVRQQVVSMATGTGKTQIFSHIPSELKDILPGQMLVLAHRSELIDQAIDKIRKANPNLTVAKEMAGDKADSNSDVIVASVATLGRKGTKRSERFNWNKIDKVITDECHHSIATSYVNIYELADVLREDTHKLHVGFTATPQRGDGKALAQIYKGIVYEFGMRKAIEEGWLVDVRGVRIATNTSLDGVNTVAGDFAQDQLADTVNNPQRNQAVVKAWLDYSEHRTSVVFSVDIQHAKDLAEMFQHYGVKAAALWGDDPERTDKLSRHRNGELTVLINCGVLTEGYDDWRIGCIVLARPTKSSVLFTQCIGRGTRLQDGTGNLKDALSHVALDYVKKDCIVIDVVDASTRHSLITLPTLMGMSAGLDLRGGSVVGAVRALEAAQKEYSHIDFTKLQDITQLQSYIEQVNLFEVKFPPEVEENSQLSWHPAADGGFILLLPNKEEVRIKQNLLDQWEISGIIHNQKYKGVRDSIEQAFKVADDLIYDKAAESLKILKREATWHNDPPSIGQINLLKKLYKGKPIPDTLTKGQASKLISSFLAGKTK